MGWIDVVMFTYNFRVMHDPKMIEAINACTKAGVGLVAMKTQGGGPGMPTTKSPAEAKMADRFLEKGFTDKQAKLKVVWETPQIASICSQMPNLTILSSNVAAARDKTKLSREDFDSLRQFAQETKSGYCAGCGQICQAAVGGAYPSMKSCAASCITWTTVNRSWPGKPSRPCRRQFGSGLVEVDYSRAERVCPQGLAIADLMRQARELLA